jgi:hypothetical protein
VTYGITRDQMMARHKANHIPVAYANSTREADLALCTKAVLAAELGLEVHLCGTKAVAVRSTFEKHWRSGMSVQFNAGFLIPTLTGETGAYRPLLSPKMYTVGKIHIPQC